MRMRGDDENITRIYLKDKMYSGQNSMRGLDVLIKVVS